MIDATCTPTKTVARPPRNRCRSSIHVGRAPPGRSPVESSSPQNTLAASSAHATIRRRGPCTTRAGSLSRPPGRVEVAAGERRPRDRHQRA